MPSCCNARGCDGFFTARMAKRAADRYRRKGLDKTAKRMLAFLEGQGIQGATVLEIGGGVGEVQIELLKRGAAHALNLELSPGYDEEAMRLVREAALEGRTERRLHDVATDSGGVEPADVVVLHRVVCCYTDYERLLGAAADHGGHGVALERDEIVGVSFEPFEECGVADQRNLHRLGHAGDLVAWR